MVSHESFINFNCDYVSVENFNRHFNFWVSRSVCYGTDDTLL